MIIVSTEPLSYYIVLITYVEQQPMKPKKADSALASTAQSLLLPAQLADAAANAVRELLDEAAAANTTRGYASALRYWAGWHRARFGVELALPVSESVVIQFLVDHILRRSKTGLVCEPHRPK